MDPETIEQLLREHLSDPHVAVSGDGRHFQALIVSPEFDGLNRIKRHRRVYEVLGDHIDSDLLHAISMRTLTPAQWREETG
jgi:acid stress-induced BolA-like protein IbaG/YrbA